MDNTQNSIVYAVNSDLDDGILYAEFETEDAAIEYAKRNLDKLPFVDELQVSRDANGEIDDVFEYKTVWDHTMADGTAAETEDDYWDDLAAMYDDSEKHAIGDTTWFESVDTDELVETLEENEDTVECKECFDLFPKADCIKVDFGYVCPTCAEGGTVSEEDLFKMDFPEYEKMSVGNDMIPDEPMIPAESSEEVPPVAGEEVDPIPTPEEAVPFLVKEEEEAIAGYEKAAEVVEESDLENKDEILEVIDQVKEEKEEHIEELTKLVEPDDEEDPEEDSDDEDSENNEEVENEDAAEEAAENLTEETDPDIADAKKALQLAKINTKIEKQKTKASKQVAKQAKADLAATKNANRATKDTSTTNVAVSGDSVKVAKNDLKKAKVDAKRQDLQSKNMDPEEEPANEESSITEAFGVNPMTKDELYDRLVNKGEQVELDIGDQGYGPEDTGSFSDGGYYGGSVVYVEFDDGKFGATEFFRSESGDEKEGYWDLETESFDELWNALVSTFAPEDLVEQVTEDSEECVDCENKKKDPLNEDLVLLGTLASALALSMANAAIGGFFWDSLKELATSIFKRKPKSKWFAYKNYIIEQTEEGQINIWNLEGEQVGTDLKTIKLAKQLVKNLSKTEDQEVPADDSSEVAAAAAEEGISDPMVEIDPDSLEAIEEVPVDEIFVAPEEDGIELTDIR